MMTKHTTPERALSLVARGFTLVELLVVVAIIGLLFGLLTPILGRAKGLARSAVCASNLRTLQLGMAQYMARHRRRPDRGLARAWVADTHWGVWWGQLGQANIEAGDVWEYVQQPAAYLCPEFVILCKDPPGGSESAPGTTYGAQYLGVGGCIVPGFTPSTFAPARSYAMSDRLMVDSRAAAEPSTIWLLEVHPWRNLKREGSLGIARAHAGPDETPGQYHNGQANCSFGDGHVKRLAPAEIRAGVDPATWPPTAE